MSSQFHVGARRGNSACFIYLYIYLIEITAFIGAPDKLRGEAERRAGGRRSG